MNDFWSILYDKFFMRDLLGKFTPGFIVVVSIISTMDQDGIFHLISKDITWVFWLILIPVSLVTGLGLQITGEFSGLHSTGPYPSKILFFPRPKGKGRSLNNGLRNLRGELNNILNSNKFLASHHERLVYLKEASGNISLAILVFIVMNVSNNSMSITPTMCIKNMWTAGNWSALGMLFFASLILWVTHRVHATRQARFEINTLEQQGIPLQPDAEELRTNLPQWLS